jgi:hypothetical protein
MGAKKREAKCGKWDLVVVKEPAFVNSDMYHSVGIVINICHELESPFYSERYYDIELYREHPEMYSSPTEPFEYVPLYLVLLSDGRKEEFFEEEIDLISSYIQP